MVTETWNLVKIATIKRAWNKLKGISFEEEVQKEKEGIKEA